MNILIITQMYPQPDDEGDNKPTKTVEYFAKEWVSAGHRVIAIHCSSKFPFVLYLTPSFIKKKIGGSTSNIIPPINSRKPLKREAYGVSVYRMPMFKPFPGMSYSDKRLKKQVAIIKGVLSDQDFKPDLVVGHFANPSTAIVSMLARAYNAGSSIVFHHDCNERTKAKYRLDKYIKGINAIGARSIIEAHSIKEILGIKRLPFICYSGVPNDAVRSAEQVCNKMNFDKGVKHIYVGSLIKRKHLDATIRAFLRSRGSDDTLMVVGGGPEEENLQELVARLDKSHSITIAGRVAREKAMQFMKDAHVFTLISHNETFGMVYLEAMLQGCLVIASKGEGFDGIIEDGVNGFLCEPGDEDMLVDIYEHIKTLTEEERNAIGQAAINTAMHYSEQEVADKYLQDILDNQK